MNLRLNRTATLASSAVVALSLLLAGGVTTSVASAAPAISSQAFATSNPKYPTWKEVQRARSNEKLAAAQVTKIEAIIADLTADAEKKHAESVKLGQVFYDTQIALDDAVVEAQQKQVLVDEANERASESAQLAGRIAAVSSRASGGKDLTSRLLFAGVDVDSTLWGLATSTKVSELAAASFERATRDRNQAEAATAQADAVKARALELAAEAEESMRDAQVAADAAQDALDESAAHSTRLTAQLDALRTNRVITEAEYQESIAAPKPPVQAQQPHMSQPPQVSNPGRPVKPTPPPKPWEPPVVPETPPAPPPAATPDWVRPSHASVGSGFGPRVGCPVCSTNHMGADFSAGRGTPILAASAGRVVYAGPNGGYGNYVKIDHGGGLTTGYAHIQDGGIQVRNGDQVTPGQQIALVGSTGNSTGPHLHFEVRVNNTAQDPVPFLRARGVSI